MRKFIFLLGCVLPFALIAQQPQFAVVRPSGTSYMCPTWDSAYNKAMDGDFIYLPGVLIQQDFTIDKRLFIYGAGHSPDSTKTTGNTTIGGNLIISSGAIGGRIEGIQCSNIYFNYSGKRIQNYIIRRCRTVGLFLNSGSPPSLDSFTTNISITENIISGVLYGSFSTSINISQNLIASSDIRDIINSNFLNNIFLYQGYNFILNIQNSIFQNNIFNTPNPFHQNYPSCTSKFYNNLVISGCNSLLCSCPANSSIESNTMTAASASDIFVDVSKSFPYTNNYHLKATCIGKNAGTDGTDVGIYGTTQPTSEGWVPSNPHIYFKQIDANTGTNGTLKIQVKVRTNN